MIKSDKRQITTMILGFSVLQIIMFGLLYRTKDPKEFASMIHQVVTNNTMRLVIIILILFVFLASMIVSSLLTSVFSFLATNLFKKKNLKYEFQCIFLIFLIVSSLQPAISTLTSPFFQTDIPIAYITALFLFGGLLIHKTNNILRSILLVLLLVVVQLVVIFIA